MAKFTLKTAKVEVADNEFLSVRGLSLNDITQLILLHREAIEGVFTSFSGRDPQSITEDDAANVAMNMIESAPALVAHIIALAADDVDAYDDYVALPLGTSVEALEKIGGLTFANGGGPKKIMGLAMKLVGSGQAKRESPQT